MTMALDQADPIAADPAANQHPALSLKSVELTLPAQSGPVEILRGIDLDVPLGETLGIVGPSGSGKTSLIMVIAGLERATAGAIAVMGQDLSRLDEDGLALLRRERIGIVFQSFHLIPTMTALENVAVPLELAGRRDAFERAEASLEQVGLAHRLDHYPGQLSGGEQQRVSLARAVAPGPRILLADEPTGNLDGDTGEAIIELLFGLQAGEGMTLLLITHDQSLAARCQRRIHLADGQIVGDEQA